ncbi:HEPN domain-containing protein [Xanthobacter versatilis]|uniref:HEPN domain-containing protein n=1 Tax=Xanthobacter autotrophicus (strain ATCC BAA-1158 / Py2) TaxID=78245 RepID=UPI00372709C3
MSVVDQTYKDLRDASGILLEASEISLHIVVDGNLRKIILLSAASYFESTITSIVLDFVEEISKSNILISSMVQKKVITRQYHTWFDWKVNNANSFFAMFGDEFSEHMKLFISKNPTVADGIKAFMEIGRDRNLLVHSNFASFLINKTPDEIYDQYRKAEVFVACLAAELRECSSKLGDLRQE